MTINFHLRPLRLREQSYSQKHPSIESVYAMDLYKMMFEPYEKVMFEFRD